MLLLHVTNLNLKFNYTTLKNNSKNRKFFISVLITACLSKFKYVA